MPEHLLANVLLDLEGLGIDRTLTMKNRNLNFIEGFIRGAEAGARDPRQRYERP